MSPPSLNIIGGTLAVAALAAVFYFGVQGCSAPPPTVALAPPQPAPVLKPPVAPAPPVVAPPSPQPRKYRRVLKGGKLGAAIDCKQVPPIAYEYSKEQVLAYAREYGLSPEAISALRVCLN